MDLKPKTLAFAIPNENEEAEIGSPHGVADDHCVLCYENDESFKYSDLEVFVSCSEEDFSQSVENVRNQGSLLDKLKAVHLHVLASEQWNTSRLKFCQRISLQYYNNIIMFSILLVTIQAPTKQKNRKGAKMQRPKLAATLLLQSVLFSFLILSPFQWIVTAQSLPPAKQDGFFYKNRRVDSDTIVVEAFFDPVCPDSRDAWPPLKRALEHYGSRVSLLVHLLPLPYHDNAYATSRALHIVNTINPSTTFRLLEWFFKYQERFYNAPTHNMSRASVVEEIVRFSAEAIGNSCLSAIESGFNDRETDLLTRVSFTLSTSRGVFVTPFFFVNGFVLPDAGSPLDYKGWRKIIDPLAQRARRA
ncbi:hypothetical protein QYF36_007304 [Acer negundo]|nr:hypothetical protein QYF36_007304 [Acer negundo]